MKYSFGFLLNCLLKVMNSDEQFYKKIGKSVIIELYNMNVTYIPLENTLNTKVKQIRNPQKEISRGFFYDKFFCL